MKIVVRADKSAVEIEGYVNAVGRDSRTLTDEYGYPYKEQMEPGVFARAIAAKNEQDIPMLLDHDYDRVIGGTSTNLTLEEDSIGCHALAVVTDPEVIKKAEEKKLRGWSFGFIPLDHRDVYTSEGDRKIITEMELVEVTLVDDEMIPVYAGTSVHTRAEGEEPQKIHLRTKDDDVIYHIIEERAAKPEESKTIDYSKYEETINRLKSR